MKRKLDRFEGALGPAAIAAGMNAARTNAQRLANDAKTLLEAGRYPSATALAALSIEESGKSAILRSMAVADNKRDIQLAWKQYRSHTSKNAMWLLPSLVARGARRLSDFAPLFDENSDHPFVLDQVKQISLYTDCLGKAHWSRPEDIIDKPLAETLVHTAQILSSSSEVLVREIELWVKHMMPVWKGAPEWRSKALANWYAGMQAEGLKPAGDNEMETFICYGLKGQPKKK